METFDWEGRRIAWDRFGSGPPVVFLHGTPFSSRVWRPYAEALADSRTVHLWDLPGFGWSSMDPAHSVTFDALTGAFVALLEHWGLDRPAVVAHDIGGLVSLRAHLLHGVRYDSLFLVDPVVIAPSESAFFRLVQEDTGLLPRLPAYVHEAIVRAYVGHATHRGLHADDLDALVEPWLGDEGQPAFYRQVADYSDAALVEVEPLLGRVDVPLRLLWGAEDAWVPLATGERLASLLGCDLTVVPEAGHLVQYDAPVSLASALRRWLCA